MSTLGVVVLSLSGMKHLDACLESVRWADAVSVVHLGEGEPSIGRGLPCPLTIKRVGSVGGMVGQEVGTDWLLWLWGEERVEAALEEELRELCKTDLSDKAAAYRIPVRSYLLGHWAEGSLWGPSPSPRLGRGVGGIACGWGDSGEKRAKGHGRLKGRIADYSAMELKEGWDRLQEISRLWAARLAESGEGLDPFSVTTLSVRIFLRLLWGNGLWANGLAGLTLPTLAAYANLLSGAKAWEAMRAKAAGRE